MVIPPEVLLLLGIVFTILFLLLLLFCFVIPDEVENYSFHVCEELSWYFNGN